MVEIKKTLSSVSQNLSAPAAALAAQYHALSAVWALAIAGGAGLLVTYTQLAEKRGKELLDFIQEHQDEFVDTVVSSPDFIDVFVNVWELHIKEAAEEKRKRLRNFLLSVGSGMSISQDNYTKIYTVIEQMTDQEALAFGILRRGIGSGRYRQMNLSSDGISGFRDWSTEDMQYVLHSLHSYRLINISDNAAIGDAMTIRQITPFGELFYNFVLKDPNNGADNPT